MQNKAICVCFAFQINSAFLVGFTYYWDFCQLLFWFLIFQANNITTDSIFKIPLAPKPDSYGQKWTKYEGACQEQGIQFTPLPKEVLAGLHES